MELLQGQRRRFGLYWLCCLLMMLVEEEVKWIVVVIMLRASGLPRWVVANFTKVVKIPAFLRVGKHFISPQEFRHFLLGIFLFFRGFFEVWVDGSCLFAECFLNVLLAGGAGYTKNAVEIIVWVS